MRDDSGFYDPTEQESDKMERICGKHAKIPDHDPAGGALLVSLGCYCGPKLSFKMMGYGSETLPFDWIRTDIDGFFDFRTKLPVPGSGGTSNHKKGMVMWR